MQSFAITITPNNTRIIDLDEKQQTSRLSLFIDQHDEYTFQEYAFEKCKKGKSAGKVHLHGIVVTKNLPQLKKDIQLFFGHETKYSRVVEIVPIYNQSGWQRYIHKEQKKEPGFLFGPS